REMLNWLRYGRDSSLRNAFYSMRDRSGIDQIIALSPIRGDTTRRDERGREYIHISGNNDFENVLEAVYRIRCNLFHGKKEADDVRDQQLVDACGRILESWIGELIRDW
ncbi:MAG: hypothetical protein IBX64_10820, partial [Actinobacteria bacterium]|nr:hypothetical protein [Actinomycetota bacterium]